MIQIEFSIKKIFLWFQIQIMFQVEKAVSLGQDMCTECFILRKKINF
jgi:hypothetical protein